MRNDATPWLPIRTQASIGQHASGLQALNEHKLRVDTRLIEQERGWLYDAITQNVPGFVATVNMLPQEYFDWARTVVSDEPLVERIGAHPRGASILRSLALAATAKAHLEDANPNPQEDPSELRSAADRLAEAAKHLATGPRDKAADARAAAEIPAAALRRVILFTAIGRDVPFHGLEDQPINGLDDARESLRDAFLLNPEGARALLCDDAFTLQALGNVILNDGPLHTALGASLLRSEAGEDLFYAAVSAAGDSRVQLLAQQSKELFAALDAGAIADGSGAVL